MCVSWTLGRRCNCGSPLLSMRNCIASSQFVWINIGFAFATCLRFVMSWLLHCSLPHDFHCYCNLFLSPMCMFHLFVCRYLYTLTLHTILIRHHLCCEYHYAACDLAAGFLFLYVVHLASLVVLFVPYAVWVCSTTHGVCRYVLFVMAIVICLIFIADSFAAYCLPSLPWSQSWIAFIFVSCYCCVFCVIRLRLQ